MPRRDIGPYGKLLANYAADDAIIAAGEAAELLFCRAVAWLSTSDSDGYMTEAQVSRYIGAGMRDALKRADALVKHGLWLRVDGGYQMRSYLKINDSAEEKGRVRRKDRERKAALTPARRREVYERDGHRCRYCGSAENLAVDHIKPLYLDGDHEISNLQTLCAPCNQRKGKRDATGLTPDEAREIYRISYGIPVTVPQPVPVNRLDCTYVKDVPTEVQSKEVQSTAVIPLAKLAPTAQTIVAEWLDRTTKRPPDRVVGQVAKLTGEMLAEGIDPDDVRRGLAAWMTKGLHPSTLPSVVNEVMNTPTGIGKATAKAAGWLNLETPGA